MRVLNTSSAKAHVLTNRNMSEEKPVLKVTDRRLFNPDGTPRDVERENQTISTTITAAMPNATVEVSVAASHTSSQQANSASSAAAAPSTPTADSAYAIVGDTSMPLPLQDTRNDSAQANQQAKQTSAAVEDPTAFVNLLMFIASPAAAALGLTEHPGIGAEEIDLPLAKHCIDLLGTLRQRTQGNLTPQEEEISQNLLAELRMQFVSLSGGRGSASASEARGRGGFSGSDITGGR